MVDGFEWSTITPDVYVREDELLFEFNVNANVRKNIFRPSIELFVYEFMFVNTLLFVEND